jgi:hypothetical protein
VKNSKEIVEPQIRPLTDAELVELGDFMIGLSEKELSNVLSPEKVEEYRDAQQSIIDARNSAPRNEGGIVAKSS